MSCTKDYCKTECKYYQEKIKPLVHEMENIENAKKNLKEEADRDYYLK